MKQFNKGIGLPILLSGNPIPLLKHTSFLETASAHSARRHAASHTAGHTIFTSSTAFLVIITLFIVVELIRKVEHAVAVYRIRFGITTGESIHNAADIALLMQDVIYLERHCKRIPLQEAGRQLGIPQQLIGIGIRVAVTATAAHGEIGR